MGETSSAPQASGISLHLTPEDVWLAHQHLAEYRPERFPDEGFVHFTDDEEMLLEVANRFYQDDPRSYLLLEVDLSQVSAPAIYEDDDQRFPHVYGPIDRHAVRGVRRVDRAPDGSFLALGQPAAEYLPRPPRGTEAG